VRTVFADTCYWIARFNPRDDLHAKAREISEGLGGCRIVTSEMVLVEFLNGFSRGGSGRDLRKKAAELVTCLMKDTNTEVIPQTSLQFRSAVELFRQRQDKEWSLTDCASFQIMNDKKLNESLTHDPHFEQAGFQALMR
jgi:predicted nucleic acid-binding protein